MRKTFVNVIQSKTDFSSNNFYAPNFVTFNFLNARTLQSIKHHLKAVKKEKNKTKKEQPINYCLHLMMRRSLFYISIKKQLALKP